MAKKISKNKKFLCSFSDLDNLSSKSFEVKIKRKTTPIFIIRKDDKVYGYINVCPHAQAPLEWNPDQYLDEKKENIICALHGATFSIEKGECVGGPCNGVGLSSVPLEVVDNDVILSKK